MFELLKVFVIVMRRIDRLMKTVDEIEALEPVMKLSDDELG